MHGQNKKYKSLLSTTDTILLIIYGQGNEQPLNGNDIGDRIIQNIRRLIAIAVRERVPTFLARQECISENTLLIDDTEMEPGGKRTFVMSSLNPFADNSLRTALENSERSRLVLAGTDGELSVTFAALSALEEGFDVYVVDDAIQATDEYQHKVTFCRLTQAGAVPVTTRQVVSEWT